MKTLEEFKAITSDAKGRSLVANKLLSVTRTEGWGILKILLEDEVRILQNQVNSLATPQEDLLMLRVRLYYLKELLGMPEDIASRLIDVKDEPHGEPVYE